MLAEKYSLDLLEDSDVFCKIKTPPKVAGEIW